MEGTSLYATSLCCGCASLARLIHLQIRINSTAWHS